MQTRQLGNSDLHITPIAIGNRHGHTPGEVAIAWMLRNPAVTGAIVGMRNAQQVEGIIGAGREWQRKTTCAGRLIRHTA